MRNLPGLGNGKKIDGSVGDLDHLPAQLWALIAGEERPATPGLLAAEVVRDRAECLRRNWVKWRDLQQNLGLRVVRHPELEAIRLEDYRDTFALDLSLVVATGLAGVSAARQREEGYFETAVTGHVKGLKRIQIPADLPDNEPGLRFVRYEANGAVLPLYPHLVDSLANLLNEATQGIDRNELPAGPGYNRAHTKFGQAIRYYLEGAGRNHRRESFKLPEFMREPIAPFAYPVAAKPNRFLWGWRGVNTLWTLYRGVPEMKALAHRLKPEEVHFLTQCSQLPEGWPVDLPTRVRMQMDRRAQRLAQDQHAAGLLRHFDVREEPDFLNRVRADAGRRINRAGGIQGTPTAFGPEAREIAVEFQRRFFAQHGRMPRLALIPTHKGTSDEMILLQGVPGSEFDRIFGGEPGRAFLVARADYDKDLPVIRSTAWVFDQRRTMGVYFIGEKDLKSIFALHEQLRAKNRSVVLFAVGGRNPFNFSHHPLMTGGLAALMAAVDAFVPVAINNSTGEEMRGGECPIIFGRLTPVADWIPEPIAFQDTRGLARFMRDKKAEVEGVAAYLWHEQRRLGFTPSFPEVSP